MSPVCAPQELQKGQKEKRRIHWRVNPETEERQDEEDWREVEQLRLHFSHYGWKLWKSKLNGNQINTKENNAHNYKQTENISN